MATEVGLGFSYVIYTVTDGETDFTIPASILTLLEFGVDIVDQFVLYHVDSSGTETVLTSAGGDWTWTGAVIRLTVATTAGSIELRRESQKTAPLVNFQGAINIDDADFDFSRSHNFQLAQEAYDTAVRALILGPDQHYDAAGLEVRRAADGTTNQSLVTLAQMVAFVGGGGNATLNTPFTYARSGDALGSMGPLAPVNLADDTFLISGVAADVDGNIMQEEELFVVVNGVIWHTSLYNLTGTFFNFIGFTPGVSDDVEVRWLPATIAAIFEDGSVGTDSLADRAVTSIKIALDAILAEHIGDDILDSEHYKALSIDAEHLAANSVPTAKIVDANVTAPKLAANILAGTYQARVGRAIANDTEFPTNHYQNTEAGLIMCLISVSNPTDDNQDQEVFIQTAADNDGSPGAWTTRLQTNARNDDVDRHTLPITLPLPKDMWIRVYDPNDQGDTNTSGGLEIQLWHDFLFGI